MWDAILAMALAAVAQMQMLWALRRGNFAMWWLPNTTVTLLQTVPLAWRRRAPLTVLLVVVSAVMTQGLSGFAPVSTVSLVSALVAIYTVSAYGSRISAPMTALIAATVASAAPLFFPESLLPPLQLLPTLSLPIAPSWSLPIVPQWWMVFGGSWLLGRVARWGWTSKERYAVGQERLRIAREIHDVIANSVAVIGVQAGAARMSFGANPARSQSALELIEDKSRQVVDEMRTLLGLLRSEDQETRALTPPPGLRCLGELIEEVRNAGLQVDMRVEGECRPLPAGMDLCVYRIVQEALTNTLKHVGPTTATVVLRYERHDIEVEILNEGPAAERAPVGLGSGLGIVGMRERTAAFGGSLCAEPRSEGGFGVKARLQLDASEQWR